MKQNNAKPYKVIWKYKNNHNHQQYNIYIFVGKEYEKYEYIFVKIRDLNLYQSIHLHLIPNITYYLLVCVFL